MNTTFFIVLWIFLTLVFLIFQIRKWNKNYQKLDYNRPKLDREGYIEILLRKGFEQKHIEVVYDEIKAIIDLNGFSMYPEDDIHRLYRIEDLDDVVLIDRICNKLNIRNAKQEDFDIIAKKYTNATAESILSLLTYLQR